MKYSVSRPVEDASRDVEWPGPDNRRLRQTTLSKTGLNVPPAPPRPPVPTRCTSPSLQEEMAPLAPLSPSLRKSAAPSSSAEVPDVAPAPRGMADVLDGYRPLRPDQICAE